MINPYENVDWSSAQQIVSVSHCHVAWDSIYSTHEQQLFFDRVINGGVVHCAISNYYPSNPTYPLNNYYTVPDGVIGCPNAEQHGFGKYGALHINSLGSFFSAGNVRDRINDVWVPRQPVGVGGRTWQEVFPDIIAQLQFSDGGGITINHPIWSGLSIKTVEEMLDFDTRVLGIEIYNQSCELQNQTGWAIEMWDTILLSGRKCWGFAAPDHAAEQGVNPWLGRNTLLVPSLDAHDCLIAYRTGAFYSRLNNTGLKFTSIHYSGNRLTITTENANTIKIIIDGVSQTYESNSVTISIPDSAIYVRAEAESADDKIFSNPIILKELDAKKNNFAQRYLLFF